MVLSNGGGVGIGKSFNGGFGLVLDGSERRDCTIRSALEWDVMNGLARRSWARNPHAMATIDAWNRENDGRGHITLPHLADDDLVERTIAHSFR